LERGATHNLAEHRIWAGELEDAQRLARRCLTLGQTHGEQDATADQILLARTLAPEGNRELVAPIVSAISKIELQDHDLRMLGILEAVAGDTDEAWENALQAIDSLPASYRIEMLKLASRYHRLDASRARQASELASKNAIWSRRSTEF